MQTNTTLTELTKAWKTMRVSMMSETSFEDGSSRSSFSCSSYTLPGSSTTSFMKTRKNTSGAGSDSSCWHGWQCQLSACYSGVWSFYGKTGSYTQEESAQVTLSVMKTYTSIKTSRKATWFKLVFSSNSHSLCVCLSQSSSVSASFAYYGLSATNGFARLETTHCGGKYGQAWLLWECSFFSLLSGCFSKTPVSTISKLNWDWMRRENDSLKYLKLKYRTLFLSLT